MSEFKGAILYVDDEYDLAILAELFVMSSFPQAIFYAARNGQEALEALPQIATDHPSNFLIMSDVQMPVMGGVEFFKQVRASENKQIAQAPIIMHTSIGGDSESVRQTVKGWLGDHDDFIFLHKPFKEHTFAAAVVQAFQGLPKSGSQT